MLFRSAENPRARGAPVNAVPRYGGHGEIDERMDKLIGRGHDRGLAFTLITEQDGFSVGWRSRSVNQTNFGDIEAPYNYREKVMKALSDTLGYKVWSR